LFFFLNYKYVLVYFQQKDKNNYWKPNKLMMLNTKGKINLDKAFTYSTISIVK